MKNYPRYIFILLGIAVSVVAVFFISCDTSDTPSIEDNTPKLRSLSAEEKEIIVSANDFSYDLFSRISQNHTGENVFISPFSVSTALSMTLNGADGTTLSAMKEALGLTHLSDDEINKAYKDLAAFLLSLDKKVALEVANSNWYRQNLTVNSNFKNLLLEYYDAEVHAANFDDPTAKDQINGWIEDKTHGKIREMLDQIPGDAVMYLINAIYFKADWQYQFDKNDTKDRDFHLADGSTTKVPTMHSKGVKLNHSYREGVQYIEIPYGNGQFNFTVLMPDNASTDINAFTESLNEEFMQQLIADTSSFTAELYLPKLKIQFKEELKEVLSDMGMGIAFTRQAQFPRLFETQLPLFISRVLHQSFLEVNEEGSEAAAATIVEIVRYSAGGSAPPVIRIDKPFVFFIREKHSGAVLFAGKVVNPM